MKHANDFSLLHFEKASCCLPFKIHTIEWVKENGIDLPNDYFMLIWIVAGNGHYRLNLQKEAVNTNQLLLIKPGRLHDLKFSSGLQGYVISFTDSFLDIEDYGREPVYSPIYQMFNQTQIITINNELADDMNDITEIMMKEYSRHNLYRSEILKRYFKIFLIYLSRQLDSTEQAPKQSRNTAILQNFMTLLNKNFRENKMVADYADRLSVTPNYLNEVVKKLTGQPAGYHIRQRVAAEAKRQAIHPDSCMKKIAYDLGFCDLAHFSKFFKNATGISFSDFKKKGTILQPVF
ncbi:helix-turn-helix transcriptional regulator [Mucilaginibacter sp. cycad4]|uniref:AraC family transcriptional regulator n=1 Tax=Mucilaginibacter sp. cycad4 TaxID=3342096 RepID=UPI002AAACD59|nr:helix-turn-helix transcriptional regulator [Mucilaginibacter gossypii]WPU97305.1 helix-turn-helix transcriptional regulator [Mucilaginibacter gossypii]